MYLIRDKETKAAVYCFDTPPVFEKFLISPITAYDIKPETHEVVEAIDRPEDFVGGAYEYEDSWKVKDQERIDSVKADKLTHGALDQASSLNALTELKQDQEGKQLTLALLNQRLVLIEKILGEAYGKK